MISSILFAFMHYSSGDFNIEIFDIIALFIDSILFGGFFRIGYIDGLHLRIDSLQHLLSQ